MERKNAYPREYKGNAIEALFRHRRMFLDFVDAFIELGSARGALDFGQAELLPQKFVTERLRAGAHDVVWRVPDRVGESFVVFLVEHQSAVDFAMPMRMLLYESAFWRLHGAATPAARKTAQGYRWPLLVPIVVYTGTAPWSGARALGEILAHGADFGHLCAQAQYLLVDIARLADAAVEGSGNFARAIVRLIRVLTNRERGSEYFAAIEGLAPFWQHEELDLACDVVYHYLMAGNPSPAMRRRIDEIFASEAIMESPKILGGTIFEKWREEGHAEGHAEGRAEGHAEGRAEKEAADLRKDLASIAQLFARKNLAWDVYGPEVEAIGTHDAMMDLMLDLATAADPAAFLRERFGR